MLAENAVGNYQLDDFLLVMAKPSLLGPSFNLDCLKHRYLIIARDVNKAKQFPEAFGRRLLEVVSLSESLDQDNKSRTRRTQDTHSKLLCEH
jgi:hypothetical protein